MMLMILAALLAGSGAQADGPKTTDVHAFSIGKETNNSVVSYDVKMTRDCRIDKDDPLDINWLTPLPNGGVRKDGLNLIEKSLYGMDVEHVDPASLQGEVKAMKSRGVKLTIDIVPVRSSGRCTVKTFVAGSKLPSEVAVSSLFLQRFDGQKPSQVAVRGYDSSNGKPVQYVVDFG